jgi:hypothetical protein
MSLDYLLLCAADFEAMTPKKSKLKEGDGMSSA